MSGRAGWQRVSRARPCPICEHPDWCLISADGSAVICPRVESPRRVGEAGWLHRLRDDPWRPARRFIRSIPIGPAAGPSTELAELAARCHSALAGEQLGRLCLSLGLSSDGLLSLGAGWSEEHRASTFPMLDAHGRLLGIRLRYPDGRKLSVRGGREGLFLPAGAQGRDTRGGRLLVCEGPTDTAALLDMGFPGAVGRPSCTGGIKLLVELVKLRRPAQVVIVADADEPGRRGADNLASVLPAYAPAVRVIAPPDGIKGARAWLRAGGTRQGVEQAIEAAPVRRLKVSMAQG